MRPAPPATGSPVLHARSLAASGGIHGALLAAAAVLGLVLSRPPSNEGAPEPASHPLVLARAPDVFEDIRETVVVPAPEVPDLDPELVERPLAEAPPPPPAREPPEVLLPGWAALDWIPPSPPEPEAVTAEAPEEAVAEPVGEPSVAPETAAAPAAAEAPEADAAPLLVEAPTPRYPRLSIRLREEGTVLCRLFVGEEGRVERVEVVRSSGHERLDEAAVEGLGRWRFRPRAEGGRPGTFVHPVSFVLESR